MSIREAQWEERIPTLTLTMRQKKKKLTKITAEQLAVVLVSELQPAAAFRRLIIEKAPAGWIHLHITETVRTRPTHLNVWSCKFSHSRPLSTPRVDWMMDELGGIIQLLPGRLLDLPIAKTSLFGKWYPACAWGLPGDGATWWFQRFWLESWKRCRPNLNYWNTEQILIIEQAQINYDPGAKYGTFNLFNLTSQTWRNYIKTM